MTLKLVRRVTEMACDVCDDHLNDSDQNGVESPYKRYTDMTRDPRSKPELGALHSW